METITYIEGAGLVVLLVSIFVAATGWVRAVADNAKLREELVVARIRLEHKDEEIERWKDNVAFEKKMRGHSEEFVAQVRDWILSMPDEDEEEDDDDDAEEGRAGAESERDGHPADDSGG